MTKFNKDKVGLCANCSKPRGKDDGKIFCRECLRKMGKSPEDIIVTKDGHKMNSNERAKKRRSIAKLYLREDMDVEEISRALSIPKGTVNTELCILRKQWRESAEKDIKERMELELAKLNRLEEKYWDGWHKSKNRKNEYEGIGNPRFLDGVGKCIRQRLIMFGIDTPQVNFNDNRQYGVVMLPQSGGKERYDPHKLLAEYAQRNDNNRIDDGVDNGRH